MKPTKQRSASARCKNKRNMQSTQSLAIAAHRHNVQKSSEQSFILPENDSWDNVPLMGNKQVKQHFDTAQKTGILKISLQRLTDFPPHMRNFPNVLKTLDISENRFVNLPADLQRFTLLKNLNVSANRLIELPEFLGQLVKLELINAANNMITSIPRSLENLKNLKQVLLANNQVKEFPIMLCGLKHLEVLDLSKNKIIQVPSQVGTLNVIELNLNQNHVTTLSPDIADCPRLKILRIEENCLPVTEIHPRILKDSKITNLFVDGNLFHSRQFVEVDGYDQYMERYTAVKKKMF